MAEDNGGSESYPERLAAGTRTTGKSCSAKDSHIANGGSRPQRDYLTTTELARLCGVSRYTILNWVNQGNIRAVRTLGGHCRIPASEAISFLEAFHLDTFHNQKKGGVPSYLGHCWEHPQKTSCGNECRDCLIYGREIDYCFVVVRQFGKEVIRCKEDCLSCPYFEEFFGFEKRTHQPPGQAGSPEQETVEEKRDVLRSFVRGVGRGVHPTKGGASNGAERGKAQTGGTTQG